MYYNHADHLGSIGVVTDKDGYLNQVTGYKPFGSLKQPNQYIGQDRDKEADLSYLNARYYDGTRGQMLTQDPVFLGAGANNKFTMILKDPQLQNSYGYARNNPLIYKDPNGELAFLVPSIIGGVLGAIGGVVTEAISGRDSSFSDYASAAGQGAVVGAGTAFVGAKVAGAAVSSGARLLAAGTSAGSLTAGTELGTNYIQGESTDYSALATKSLIAAGTAGTLSRLPKVKGRTPNLGTEAFFTGKHTQRQGAEEAVQVSTQSLGSSARAYNSDGATRALNTASNSLNNKRRK